MRATPKSIKTNKRRHMRQLELRKTGGWGGRRKRSGRKKKPGAGINHIPRERFKNLPIHVTLRVRDAVWNLRSRRCYTALAKAFGAGRARFGLRLCHFSVQGNHLHFVIEADNTRSMSRGMQGLAIRMAKSLNRVMNRRGSVFADRFHAHVLRTPSEVRHALAYVLATTPFTPSAKVAQRRRRPTHTPPSDTPLCGSRSTPNPSSRRKAGCSGAPCRRDSEPTAAQPKPTAAQPRPRRNPAQAATENPQISRSPALRKHPRRRQRLELGRS